MYVGGEISWQEGLVGECVSTCMQVYRSRNINVLMKVLVVM